MKAIAVHPGKANSIHLADLPEPSVGDIADGRGVLVEVLRVGVDGTDKEINVAKYGAAPPGYDFLVTGHENFGRVLEVGPNVPSTIQPGGFVVSTVRRPGHSIYDEIGLQDMTTDDTYYERGINLLHGYLTERYVEDSQYVVPLPESLREVGVLLEPTTVAEKGINQAYEIQRRLRVWQPRRAARQERRPRAGERHRRRPQGRRAGGQDQPGLRPRKQGDGGDRERVTRRLRARRHRPDQGRVHLPGLAREAADDAGAGPRPLP